MIKSGLLLLTVLASISFASIGVDANLQKPFNATGNCPIISLSILKTARKPPLYFSSGIAFRPGQTLSTVTEFDGCESIKKTHSFFGLFAGTHIAFSPAIRPSIVAGFSFKREEVVGISEGKQVRIDYTPYRINPYFGIELHCFILSFLVTNEGFGGGVNCTFGG
ncbi:MAG: hypothetical protein JXK07_13385 [Spirochaetes bacterium]|nr:hypothetical protein [Spirochaetota bacterium]